MDFIWGYFNSKMVGESHMQPLICLNIFIGECEAEVVTNRGGCE